MLKGIFNFIGIITFFSFTNVVAMPSIFEDFSDTLSYQKFKETEQSFAVENGEMILKSKGKSFLPIDPLSSNYALIRDSGAVTSMSADLKVTDIELGNTNSQQAMIRMAGHYYFTDEGRAWVALNLGDRGNGLEAWYEIFNDTYGNRLINSTYQSSVYVAQGSLALEGLSLGNSYPASITYDGEVGLTFTFNNGTPVTVSGPEKHSASDRWKLVSSRIRFGQSNNTPETYEDFTSDDGSTAMITGTVDNVTTNISSLQDDFSSSSLSSIWYEPENSTLITNTNKLEMVIDQSSSNRTTERLILNQKNLKFIGAKVTLSSDSAPSDSARVRARITTYVGNDTYDVDSGDTPDGYTGNLWTTITIERRADGSFRMFAYIERANDANYNSSTQVFFEELTPSTPVGYDVEYAIAIEQIGETINFIVDGATLSTYDLSTSDVLSGNLYNPTPIADTQLNARIQDGSGKVVAFFDDITTNLDSPTVTLSGVNSDDTIVVLPEEVITNVGELVSLVANASNASDIIRYVWEQIGGTPVEITPSSSAKTAGNLAAKIISTENTLSFTVPDGADTENLEFKLTTVNKAGLETEELFNLFVDNTQNSTLSPSELEPEPTSSGGGSFSYIFLFLMIFGFAIRLKSNYGRK